MKNDKNKLKTKKTRKLEKLETSLTSSRQESQYFASRALRCHIPLIPHLSK